MTIVWHGTHAESTELMQAVARNCACEFRVGVCVSRCAVHEALTDQRWLDGLLFMRSRREQLRREEMSGVAA
jgi:hypothetical protein